MSSRSSKSSSKSSRTQRLIAHHQYGGSSSSSASDSDGTGYRYSMDSAQRPVVSVELLRCMRCARNVEVTSTDDASSMGMIRVGHNIYYCDRCAKLVGYK